jgi:hypothetical protein
MKIGMIGRGDVGQSLGIVIDVTHPLVFSPNGRPRLHSGIPIPAARRSNAGFRPCGSSRPSISSITPIWIARPDFHGC